MLRVGIWLNNDKEDGVPVAIKFIQLLEMHGAIAVLDIEFAIKIDRADLATNLPLQDSCDILAVFGGDGTLLHASGQFAMFGLPILGINLGRLGFLSEIEPDLLEDYIPLLLNGDYSIEKRMMLEVHIADGEPLYALNDLVITRDVAYSRMISLEISVGGVCLDKLNADGIIISSPTGSTAYSLSAGGPVIDPGLECMVIAPICAHTLRSRPIVVPAIKTITISQLNDSDQIHATLDGRYPGCTIPTGCIVRVSKAPYTANFIRIIQKNFYDLLRSKLSDWSR